MLEDQSLLLPHRSFPQSLFESIKLHFKSSPRSTTTPSTSSEDSFVTMPSKATRARRLHNRLLRPRKTSPEKKSSKSTTEQATGAQQALTKKQTFNVHRARQDEDSEDSEEEGEDPEVEAAFNSMLSWTWEDANFRPPRPSTPNLGPMNEPPPPEPTNTYQGMPREQCQLLIPLFGVETEDTIHYFENIYRDAKFQELAGAGGEFTPEQIFKAALDEFREEKREWELQCLKDEERARLIQAERTAGVHKWRDYGTEWPKESEGGPTWPKWGEDQEGDGAVASDELDDTLDPPGSMSDAYDAADESESLFTGISIKFDKKPVAQLYEAEYEMAMTGKILVA